MTNFRTKKIGTILTRSLDLVNRNRSPDNQVYSVENVLAKNMTQSRTECTFSSVQYISVLTQLQSTVGFRPFWSSLIVSTGYRSHLKAQVQKL